ncbi:hypothetical protein OG874_35750 [Nocardia sp. NBC_00565]|uniref:hypothetical protein n=1 Tax=Nocardia sp. NBC_00565 TaxID=2975993 RepID=UPI002E8218FC|nr:hypothetical protein [Nocardia sp. NBC_00565]WUC02046.1 hypothetical protein OG874_35750 [Nocardia sp. NBC_00565]
MTEEVDEITNSLRGVATQAMRVALDTVRTYRAAKQGAARDGAAQNRANVSEARAAARETRDQQRHQLRTIETTRRLEVLDQNAEFAKELARDQLSQHQDDAAIAEWAAARATADIDPDRADAYDERLTDAGLDPDEIQADAERLLASEPGWMDLPIDDSTQLAADLTLGHLDADSAHSGTQSHSDDATSAAARLISEAHPPNGATTGPAAPAGAAPPQPNASAVDQALQL